MDGNTKLLDLTVGQYEKLGKKLIQDVSTSHFIKAADDLFWKNAKTIGVELTGKDITENDDVLCIRRTFDESQKCRIKKERKQDAKLTEWAKKSPAWIIAFVMLLISIYSNFYK